MPLPQNKPTLDLRQMSSYYLHNDQVHKMFEQTWFMVCSEPPVSDGAQAARDMAS